MVLFFKYYNNCHYLIVFMQCVSENVTLRELKTTCTEACSWLGLDALRGTHHRFYRFRTWDTVFLPVLEGSVQSLCSWNTQVGLCFSVHSIRSLRNTEAWQDNWSWTLILCILYNLKTLLDLGNYNCIDSGNSHYILFLKME